MSMPFGNKAKEKFWRITGGFVAIPALLLWIFSMSFYDMASRQRNPSNGSIYPLNNHGVVVYLTKAQQNGMKSSQITAVVLAVAAAIISAYSRKRYRTSQVEVSPQKRTYLLHSDLEEQEKRRNHV